MKLKKVLLIDLLIITAALSGCQKEMLEKQETSPAISEQSQSMEGNATEAVKKTEVTQEPENTIIPEEKPNEANMADSNEENAKNKTGELISPYPYLMETPPFAYYIAEDIKNTSTIPLKLTELLSKKNQITDEAEWFTTNNLVQNTYSVSDLYKDGGDSLPDDIPATWNDLTLTMAFYDDSYIYCTYGTDGSYGYILKVYEKDSYKEAYCIDFSNYTYSPEYKESDYNYIQQKVNGAAIKDNILYVSHSHLTYADSSNGMNAYITAIDLSDMNVLWRSEALVSNANNIVLLDDVIISGYGFTDESDYLYQIDRITGKVIAKTPLASAASYIIVKEDKLYIRTYHTDYVYQVTH
ncbi:hypothetical protein acsn021_21380 [Anaerocolumna cellulosilytica]|uniref:Uncharacterized protein n=1 Tax=Anaerocolumna cellulosilytica TaxID=433286 RepID=A0A6S6QZU7_9FIRM|nr:hypothetical protein [Anaerocolumna cellulosilytica]MBB5194219.1 hypothetical protein [Anaerocolumna cellulosilytica]BCJ94569.1 hypothetical protein acsn021_21380 [Anaerocolumna cellulosilytica]